jgi:3-oxoacyl-ACP reductase-like protein
MSIFSSILSKLGLGTPESAAAPAAAPVPAPVPAPAATTPAPAAPTTISPVDVVSKLEAMAASNPERLNWKVSIVDLLKLLGLDSSLTARKALATELGCPAAKMEDSASMNIWLHQTVMQKLAANGGNIPADLLK